MCWVLLKHVLSMHCSNVWESRLCHNRFEKMLCILDNASVGSVLDFPLWIIRISKIFNSPLNKCSWFWELRNLDLLVRFHLRYKSESTPIYLVLMKLRSKHQFETKCKWNVCAVILGICHITVIITDNVALSHWWSMHSIVSLFLIYIV